MISEENQEISNSEPTVYKDDSNKDRPYVQHCEVPRCKDEVWAACPKCLRLLCWTHFIENGTCDKMHSLLPAAAKQNIVEIPEQFVVEGNSRENDSDLFVKSVKTSSGRPLDLEIGEKLTYLTKLNKRYLLEELINPDVIVAHAKKIGKKCDQITDEIDNKFSTISGVQGIYRLQTESITAYINGNRRNKKLQVVTMIPDEQRVIITLYQKVIHEFLCAKQCS
ncbi:unnamed protein product [Ceutorhynchus assimilis]|uniref:Uncharacterized protein n=1 Tax=Ceutorhynchus assimilis TaxID=467358 RepID=A0A9N9MCM5_9CUCU|nr:unnamed protein product [Ceutorhynchus assimilis]